MKRNVKDFESPQFVFLLVRWWGDLYGKIVSGYGCLQKGIIDWREKVEETKGKGKRKRKRKGGKERKRKGERKRNREREKLREREKKKKRKKKRGEGEKIERRERKKEEKCLGWEVRHQRVRGRWS